MKKSLLLAIPATVLAFAFTACEEKGPMERAGEDLDEAAENVGDAAKDATE